MRLAAPFWQEAGVLRRVARSPRTLRWHLVVSGIVGHDVDAACGDDASSEHGCQQRAGSRGPGWRRSTVSTIHGMRWVSSAMWVHELVDVDHGVVAAPAGDPSISANHRARHDEVASSVSASRVPDDVGAVN